MGTRGFVGFVIDGAEKISYNHSDSYPDGLGVNVLGWLRPNVTDLAAIKVSARSLEVVDGDSEPTDEQAQRLITTTDRSVGGRSERPTWYQLLRGTQGKPGAILAAGYIEDASTFPMDSLFAEWGYIVDLDGDQFEAYKGFQNAPHTGGRFADRPPHDDGGGYYPVQLVAKWPLSDLPSDEDFLAVLDPDGDE